MKKIKPMPVQSKSHPEQSNPERFDLPGPVNISLEAQQISKFSIRITESEAKITQLEAAITTLLELKSALVACDRDKKDPITADDVDAQINFFKREIHIYQSKIRRIENKLQAVFTQDVIKSEHYLREMPELKLRKKELQLDIQKLEIAIACLKKTTVMLELIPSLFENVIREFDVNLQIQLLEKNKQKYIVKLQTIETKLTDLETRENQKSSVAVIQTQTNVHFFAHQNSVIKKLESGFDFNELKLN